KIMKGQFKSADRLNAKYIAVLGEDELNQKQINVKDAKTGDQQAVGLDEFIRFLKTYTES
ncbi:His/Gly/Thr/Pro-type tRNA ligase C-terminal domain-containing protein, partial [Bacillus haynesii]|uniref:His/Gly/Thr/Pro-type tRNA ligase C-terminal domain-containing protein n=1 Tax=Bacillus haynesii TaxID=1925021 RepID=UPI0022807668